MGYAYLRDPDEIYRQSFATIEREADLERFSAQQKQVAIRMIHACGQVEIADQIAISPHAIQSGLAALQNARPVICDVKMVEHGLIRRNLKWDNPVLCSLDDPEAASHASELATTRTAAGMDLLADRIGAAIVVIGNAPTALFHLLEIIDSGATPPALVIGIPVGFVGAAESKEALAARTDLPFITLSGRAGGSAIASAALNALAILAQDPQT